MTTPSSVDPELIARLPLPLAQVYRRASNAKTAHERHLLGFYLWEAALKLLGSTALGVYASQARHDPSLVERLQNLARPSPGHWWEFVRLLVSALAEGGDPGFRGVRDLVLGRTRDDLPRVAGLDAALLETLESKTGARTTVRLTELFDRLVRYRNSEIGHGASAARAAPHHERLGRALLAGMTQLLQRLDVLAGRRLVYIADVRLLSSGHWLVERYELKGERALRIGSLELSDSEETRKLHPFPERVYLDSSSPEPGGADALARLVSLHPLLWHDFDADETFFLNARRGKTRIELLSYTTGRSLDRADLASGQQELLGRLLDLPVAAEDVAAWAERSRAEEPSAPDLSAAPRRLGEFELLSELGRGGMGIVYRAWQPSLGRQVAVKKLFQVGDARAEARFAREIRALGRVEHPHLVKVFASGAEGDQWFYAMELIEGATLGAVAERLQARSTPEGVDWRTWHEVVSTACAEARRAEKPLNAEAGTPTPEAAASRPRDSGTGTEAQAALGTHSAWHGYVQQVVELVRQTAEAAHALHERGVLHRDIKPGNIMVTADGTQAVLMDLGLAQLADDVEGRLTRTRQFVGTLRYASPEQVLAVGGLDRRSDVYNLGATLWELLTLHPLFGASEATPAPELMRRIQYEEVERPGRYNQGLARDLEAIVFKCLEKNPGKRYATALELARDLERYQHGEVVQARAVPSWERGWKWSRRHPALAGLMLALVLGVLALAGGIIGTSLALTRAWAAEKQADADKKHAEEERAIALAMTAFLQKDVLGQADVGKQRLLGQYGAPGDPNVTVRELLDRAAPAIEGLFGKQPLLEAEIRLAIGDTFRAVQQYDKAQPHLERSLALYQDKLGPDHPDTLGCKNDLAVLYHAEAKHGRSDALLRAWQANFGRSEKLLREVLDLRKKQLGPEDPDTLATEHNLATLYYDELQFDRAEPLLLELLAIREKKLGPDHLDTLTTRNNLCMVYYDQGMLDRTMPLWPELLEKFEKKLGAEDVRALACKGNVADLLRDLEKYDVAEKMYREVIAGQEKKLGPDHTDTLKNKRGLAWLYDYQGKYDLEEPLLAEVLKIREKKLGPEDPDTLQDKGYLAYALFYKGERDRAEQLLRDVIKTEERKLGAEHRNTLEMKGYLAGFYKDQGKYDRAEPAFQEVLGLREKVLGPDHLWTLNTRFSLADVCQAEEKYDRAAALYREVLEGREKKLGADDSATQGARNSLAACCQAWQKFDAAEKLYQEVLERRQKKQGPDHADTLGAMNNLAGLYQAWQKPERAEKLYTEVLELRRKKQGADHPDTLAAKNTLAAFYQSAQKLDLAEKLYKEVLEAREKQPGPDHPDTLISKNTLAWLYQDQGKYDRAEPLLVGQLASLEKTTKKDTPQEQELAGVQSQLGMVWIHLNKYDKAEKVLRDCLAIREKQLPDDWRTFNTKAQLGAALAGQKKYPEAEKLLVDGYEGMKSRKDKIPPVGLPRMPEAVSALVKLYEDWDKKDKAAEWRKQLSKKD